MRFIVESKCGQMDPNMGSIITDSTPVLVLDQYQQNESDTLFPSYKFSM